MLAQLHLEVEADELAQVAARVRVLGAEDLVRVRVKVRVKVRIRARVMVRVRVRKRLGVGLGSVVSGRSGSGC